MNSYEVSFCFLTPVLTGSSDEGQRTLAASQQMAPLARFSIILFFEMSTVFFYKEYNTFERKNPVLLFCGLPRIIGTTP